MRYDTDRSEWVAGYAPRRRWTIHDTKSFCLHGLLAMTFDRGIKSGDSRRLNGPADLHDPNSVAGNGMSLRRPLTTPGECHWMNRRYDPYTE